MVIPNPAVKVTISGHLGSGEVFATSFWQNGPASGSMQSFTDVLVTQTPFLNFLAAMQAVMNTADGIDRVDAYKYTGGTVATDHGTTAITRAGTAAAAQPKSCAIVLTLRTANTSRRGRGRMFIPFTAGGLVNGQGITATAQVQALCDTLALYAIGLSGNPALSVLSQADGVLRPVTRVDADLVSDVQRGRTAHIPKTRVGKNVS